MILHNGEVHFFLPALEIKHAEHQVPFISNITSYYDYPGEIHPMKHLVEYLKNQLVIKKDNFAIEAPGSSGYWGYLGPKLDEVLGHSVNVLPNIVTDMRIIKEPVEIQLIRESSKWAAKTHYLLQEYTDVGENEIDVSIKASLEGSKKMQKSLGEGYKPRGWSMFPTVAGYRGQIGIHSAFPHAQTQGLVFKKGDVLVTGATANVYGYYTELERTMFMGEPSKKQKELFDVMFATQKIALEAITPGITCSKVDKTVREFIKERGYSNLTQHHTGHALGIEGHERPFLDIGDNIIMTPGMVFSCEPGFYDNRVGGFRHSDTLAVTEDGAEVLTIYPNEIEDLII